MRDTIFRGEKFAIEDFAGIATGEVAGFGDGMEKLNGRSAMDWEIIDGFMGYRVVGYIWCCWEHRGNGSGIGGCECFALVLEYQSLHSGIIGDVI